MAEPHRIEIPPQFGLDGAYVHIKPKQSWSARNRLDATRYTWKAGVGGDDVSINVAAYTLAVLETAIVSWQGVIDAEGKPLPASRAGYMHDDFDPDLGDWLVDAISAHYAAQRRPAEDTSAEGKPEAPPSPTP